jgi:hypothetical protein
MRSTFKVLFYLKRNKDKDQKVVPVMGRITVNGSIAQFSAKLSVPEMLWEVSGGRAKGRSLEADRINRHLDNIRTQIGKHYQDICDRESYVTAEKVKNAYLGFGEKYRLLLEAFEKFTGDLKKRVGIDRCHGTWNRYYKSIDHLRTFMRKEYNVSDMPLAELEQSFIEQYHVYLKSDLGLKPTTVSGYLKCLKYVVKIAFNNGWMPRNPFSLYQYTAPNPERSFLTEDELHHRKLPEKKYKSPYVRYADSPKRVFADGFLFLRDGGRATGEQTGVHRFVELPEQYHHQSRYRPYFGNQQKHQTGKKLYGCGCPLRKQIHG